MMAADRSYPGAWSRISFGMLIASLVSAIALPLPAQILEQKISPGRLVADIPSGSSIQSAASLDRHLLTVWGSGIRRPDGIVTGSLWYQMLEDGTPIGSPAPVPDAVPHRFLSVQPVDGRYFIVWNDIRGGAPVLYLRIADTSGLLLQETVLWQGEISDAGIALFKSGDGYRLVWSGSGEDFLRGLAIDRSGAPTGSVAIVASGAVGRIVEPDALPGYRIIERASGLPLLFAPDGSEHPLGGSGARLAAHHAIADDGTLAILAADTLRLYNSIVDSVASHTVSLSFRTGRIRGSEIAQFDSSGQAVVLYAAGGGSATGPAEILSIDLYAIQPLGRDTVPFSFGKLLMRRTIAAPARSCEYITLLADTAFIVQGIGGNALLSVRLGGTEIRTCQETAVAGSISLQDRFHLAGGEPHPDTLLPVAVGPSSPVDVERRSTPRGSTIVVNHDSVSARLVAPAAERTEMRHERFPGITEIDGRLIVGWVSGSGDTSAMLGEWRPDGSVIRALDSIDLSAIAIDDTFRLHPNTVVRIGARESSFNLTTTHTWYEPNDRGGTSYRQRSSLLLPTSRGWHSALVVDTTDRNAHPQIYSTSYDFKRKETLVSWGYRDPATAGCFKVHVDAYDGSGQIIWKVDSVNHEQVYTFYTAPIGKDDFVWTEAAWFRRFRNNRIIDAVYIPEYYHGDFINLRFPYVLCHYPLVGELQLRLFDIRGNELGYIRKSPRPGLPKEVCILQDPVDSTIILLWGGHGVTMARYDRTLRQIGGDRIISLTRDSVWRPAALFRGDTLHVVWEDYRDGVSSIYGMTMPHALVSGVASPTPVTGLRGGVVHPNPLGDEGTISLGGPAGSSATVEIIDRLGRLLRRIPVERGAIVVPLSVVDFPAGAYLALLRDGERIETISFVVSR